MAPWDRRALTAATPATRARAQAARSSRLSNNAVPRPSAASFGRVLRRSGVSMRVSKYTRLGSSGQPHPTKRRGKPNSDRVPTGLNHARPKFKLRKYGGRSARRNEAGTAAVQPGVIIHGHMLAIEQGTIVGADAKDYANTGWGPVNIKKSRYLVVLARHGDELARVVPIFTYRGKGLAGKPDLVRAESIYLTRGHDAKVPLGAYPDRVLRTEGFAADEKSTIRLSKSFVVPIGPGLLQTYGKVVPEDMGKLHAAYRQVLALGQYHPSEQRRVAREYVEGERRRAEMDAIGGRVIQQRPMQDRVAIPQASQTQPHDPNRFSGSEDTAIDSVMERLTLQ